MRERQCIDLHPEVSLILEPIERADGQQRREAELSARTRLLQSLYGNAVDYAYRADGSPYLVSQPNLYISLSHSESLLAFAASPSLAVGVDIEPLGEQVGRVVPRFCSDEESALAHRTGIPHLLFLHLLWSAKESAYKLSQAKPASLHAFVLRSIESLGSNRFYLQIEEVARGCILSVSALATDTFVLTLAYH